MIDQLPPELERFVDAEVSAPAADDAAKRAIRAKLGATLGIATVAAAATVAVGSSTAATAATGTAGGAATGLAGATAGATAAVKGALAVKLIAVALGVGTGTVATIAVTRDREPQRPAVVERAKRAPAAPAPAPSPSLRVEPIEDVPPIVPEISEPTIAEPPRRATTKRTEPAPVAAPAPSPTQSQLLADASRSLSQGNSARALELIDQDTRAHADGPLAEEREALRISALVALDRITDAQAAARRLLTSYPNSIHRRLAEQVLAEETP
jgi:hypothetical protein